MGLDGLGRSVAIASLLSIPYRCRVSIDRLIKMTTSSTPASSPMRAIDRLRKAANFEPIRQSVTLADGSEFEFYATPLTAAERERAQKDAKSDSANEFALQLLINKAIDENGNKLFRSGDIPVLKREVEDEDLQKIMICVLKPRGSDDAEPDSKSN